MKGELTLKILEAIGQAAIGTADLLEAFLSAGYGASSLRVDYEISRIEKERRKRLAAEAAGKKEIQRYHNLIYKLKRDNLIIEKTKNNRKFFTRTMKGRNRLLLLKEREAKKLPDFHYSKEGSDKFTIVIFDIPEKERRKRGWLRAILKNFGLRMIQKSVFIGKVKIPDQFIDDLRRLRLIHFVEIFEISK